jgi:uncharacterized protein (TIGR00375 family)
MIEKNGAKEYFANPENSDEFLGSSKESLGFFADLHIHSRFSRACSKDLNLDNLEKWARVKGIDLLGTGDFTHPVWINELKANLADNKKGIFHTKTGFKFILTGEISLMYTQGHGRSVHLVLLAPSFDVVDKINGYLDKRGRRDYDGRPIFKITCEQFTKDMKEISDYIEIIPAHIWTPYFGVFGSESGFDSLKEAFGSQFDNVNAIETGMSSDPAMNWKISELNSKTIVSFSDLHSFWPWRMGREATIFSSIQSYEEIINQIRENRIIGTVETDPAYGKYHWDGHRNCSFSCSYEDTRRYNGICPVCKSNLTIGVENRIEKLKNQAQEENKNRKNYYKILPLHELISAFLNSSINSKKVWAIYNRLLEKFNNEFNILLIVSRDELEKIIDKKLAELILHNRQGKIQVRPGFDGNYGVMILDGKEAVNYENDSEKAKNIIKNNQKTLFECKIP